MSQDAIRVGVVGAGGNTRTKHIPNLQAIEGVEVVSVCNRSRQSSQRAADEFGIPTVYDQWWELIAANDTDAIVIGTWPYLHRRATVAALNAGKHVMCEARMAMNASEAIAMRAAARANPHLVAQIVPSPMTLGVDKTIQKLMAQDYLGAVLAIEVRALGNDFIDPAAPLTWRQDKDLSGLNVMSLGIWYEAILRWVGEAERVSAMGKSAISMRRDDEAGRLRNARVPEHITVMADMACGAQATISISTLAGLSGPPEVFIYGEKGTLRFAGGTLYGGQKGDESLNPVAVAAQDVGGWRVEEEFINAVRGQEVITHTNFEDGVKYMIFTEAVALSMAEGRTISLPSLLANRGG